MFDKLILAALGLLFIGFFVALDDYYDFTKDDFEFFLLLGFIVLFISALFFFILRKYR